MMVQAQRSWPQNPRQGAWQTAASPRSWTEWKRQSVQTESVASEKDEEYKDTSKTENRELLTLQRSQLAVPGRDKT